MDAGGGEPLDPLVERGPVGDRERQVVQADPGLRERLLVAVAMLGQREAGRDAGVAQEDLPEATVGRGVAADPLEAEHVLVPGGTGVDVTYGESEMAQARDHRTIV